MLILGAEISEEVAARCAGALRASGRAPEAPMDLRCEGGRITELAHRLTPRRGERVLEARGGALIPGLHDHHLHLFALAADLASVPCGPPRVESRAALTERLHSARPIAGWLRGTGYFESVAGDLDRRRLDEIAPAIPVRIQHRSGSMWFLNSPAIEALGLDRDGGPSGIERDGSGRATGRLFRADAWLRERLPETPLPDLAPVGAMLARTGVTAVTDATPVNGVAQARRFREAQRAGALPQRIELMGDATLEDFAGDAMLEIGACKILLDEPFLPDLDQLVAQIRAAHRARRGVAIHCVTRTEIHFALAALEAAGPREGDRIEHASVSPPEAFDLVKRLGVRIVTQPNFVAERGDAYRSEVDASDLPDLYRVRSWLDAGIPIAAGTDAPFGHPDPWRAMAAAVHRRTRSGEPLGAAEAVSPEIARSLFTRSSTRSFGPADDRDADLCLLDAPWRTLRDDLSSEHVVATVRGGDLIWSRTP